MTSPHDADLYDDLGLTRAASRVEITRAYRDLLRQHHPDTRAHQHHPGPDVAPSHSAPTDCGASDSGLAASSDEALNRAVAAYAVLTDPDRRARYDHHQRNHRVDGEQHAPPPAAAYPTPPTRTPVGPSWPAEGGAPREGQPPIKVGPVRWHRVSPTTSKRP